MDTCFLFAKHLTDTGCVALKLSQEASLVVPPEQLSFDKIRSLQKNCKTIIIEDSENTSMLSLELTWLPERKARLAIPFALEDKLAQPISSLHFAFDKLRYQDNHYLVTVISKERLREIELRLKENAIDYDLITTDWFALSPQELIVSESSLLIHYIDFKGALSGDLATHYLSTHPLNQPILFQDSQIRPEQDLPQKDEQSLVWIAQRLLRTKPLNLCQGEMQAGHESASSRKKFYLAGFLCCLWLLSLVMVKALELQQLSNKTAQIDGQIAVIYKQFFPNANQVVSPKFRIQQVLKGIESASDARFWYLLNQFAKSMTIKTIKIEQLRYQTQSLTTMLVSPDFASLEHLKDAMRSNQLKVKQTQASTRNQQVVATLELT
ncbi:MAG: general secretion pathway protein GspL [Legionella sp.]|nr:general secretion pathway protein GspL [Legionella sp.]